MRSFTRRTPLCLSAILLLATIICFLCIACTQSSNDTPSTADSDTTVTSDTLAASETTPATDTAEPESRETTPSEETMTETNIPETETETEDHSDQINIPTDAAHVTFFSPTDFNLRKMINRREQCVFDIAADETYGSVLQLTTTDSASDPHIFLQYDAYMKALGLEPVSADQYKYIVFTIRVENCTCDSFQLYYCAGDVQEVSTTCSKTAFFNATEDEWQYIAFDLSDATWSGDIHQFRLDFLTASQGQDEKMYIYAIDMYTDSASMYAAIGMDRTLPGEGSDLTEKPVDGVIYDKLTAPDEDDSVDLWFDHVTEKYAQTNTTSSGRYTYVIHMAGNSIEDCQFLLAPQTDRTFSISLSDFTDEDGHTLRAEVLTVYYADVLGEMLPDALPPLSGDVTVQGGHSQGFVIKVWAGTDETPGLYTATLRITDAVSGKVVKTARVYTLVYDFSLSEETALRTATGLDLFRSNTIYKSYQHFGMTDLTADELYKIYYDFLLENRLCAYQLPYYLTDAEVVDYLNNPRVTSFVINHISEDEAEAYNILKVDPTWQKKAFYYYVDEPYNTTLLDELAAHGERLESNYPGYNQVCPFFTDITIGDTDQIEFMKPYISIWCTKPFSLTPREKAVIPGTQYITTTAQDQQYGTFAERMAALQEQGDELWLYVCWEPEQPYANWLIHGDGTEPIVSIWQCKQVGATGMLYWSSNYWHDYTDSLNDLTPVVGTTSQGDGTLLYSGAQVGIYEPISSLRLEAVRMGIQDYQLLTMLENALGAEAAAEMVAMVTEDIVTYTSDDDYLKAVRILLLEKVAETRK